MIGADGRGLMAGYEEALKHLQKVPEEEIKSIASRILSWMREQGYAHLDPEEQFIQGFIVGYYQSFMQL